MTELTEGDKMALMSQWVPLDAAYTARLVEQHEREQRARAAAESATEYRGQE